MPNNNLKATKGLLLIISGPSGSGKGSIAGELLTHERFVFSVSATSRPPRRTEEDGVHYFFKTKEQFEELIMKNELLEWAEFLGNYYGTPKKYVEEQLRDGMNVILDIEVQGALQVKRAFPESVLIFILPPNTEELKRRLIGRGTEDENAINARMKKSREELSLIDNYDYIVVNDTIFMAVNDILSIVRAEPLKVHRNIDIINRIKGEIK